jgi:hypothetical protein
MFRAMLSSSQMKGGIRWQHLSFSQMTTNVKVTVTLNVNTNNSKSDDNIGVIICLGDNIDNNFCQNGNIV